MLLETPQEGISLSPVPPCSAQRQAPKPRWDTLLARGGFLSPMTVSASIHQHTTAYQGTAPAHHVLSGRPAWQPSDTSSPGSGCSAALLDLPNLPGVCYIRTIFLDPFLRPMTPQLSPQLSTCVLIWWWNWVTAPYLFIYYSYKTLHIRARLKIVSTEEKQIPDLLSCLEKRMSITASIQAQGKRWYNPSTYFWLVHLHELGSQNPTAFLNLLFSHLRASRQTVILRGISGSLPLSKRSREMGVSTYMHNLG